MSTGFSYLSVKFGDIVSEDNYVKSNNSCEGLEYSSDPHAN